jgi:hypothetical protein
VRSTASIGQDCAVVTALGELALLDVLVSALLALLDVLVLVLALEASPEDTAAPESRLTTRAAWAPGAVSVATVLDLPLQPNPATTSHAARNIVTVSAPIRRRKTLTRRARARRRRLSSGEDAGLGLGEECTA